MLIAHSDEFMPIQYGSDNRVFKSQKREKKISKNIIVKNSVLLVACDPVIKGFSFPVNEKEKLSNLYY